MERKRKNKPCVPMVGSPGGGYNKRWSWVYSRAPFIDSAVWALVDLDRFPCWEELEWVLKVVVRAAQRAHSRGFNKDAEFFHNFCSKTAAFWSPGGGVSGVTGRIKTRSVCNWAALETSGLAQSDTSPHPWATSVHCNMSSHRSPGQLQLKLIAHNSAPHWGFPRNLPMNCLWIQYRIALPERAKLHLWYLFICSSLFASVTSVPTIFLLSVSYLSLLFL